METIGFFILIIIFGIFIAPIAIVFKNTVPKKEKEKQSRIQEPQKQESDIVKTTEITIPQETSPYTGKYRAKQLLTKTEKGFYGVLKTKCDNANLIICPKVRLEDFIEVTSKEIYKYRGMIKSRHIDFLICSQNMKVLAGIELDDPTHKTQKAKEADKFKNELYSAIKIPLYRIKTSENYAYRIEKMIEEQKNRET